MKVEAEVVPGDEGAARDATIAELPERTVNRQSSVSLDALRLRSDMYRAGWVDGSLSHPMKKDGELSETEQGDVAIAVSAYKRGYEDGYRAALSDLASFNEEIGYMPPFLKLTP